MKFILITMALMLNHLATHAADLNLNLPEQGSYLYTGESKLEIRKFHHIVYAQNEEGQAELSKLRENGFSCEYKNNQIFLCSIFVPSKFELSQDVQDRVNAYFSENSLEVSALANAPEKLYQGDAYVEYLVSQSIKMGAKNYPNYRYQISQDLHKITLGNPAEVSLVANPDKSFEMVYTLNHRIDEKNFEWMMFSGKFKKK